MRKLIKSSLICFILSGLLTGCADSWFGENKKLDIEGERISILEHGSDLKPEAAGTEIVLPRPIDNKKWPEAGGLSNHAMLHLQAGDALAKIWDTDIGKGSTSRDKLLASPVVGSGAVYTVDRDGTVKCFDLSNGKRVWDVDIEIEHSQNAAEKIAGLAFNSNVLYITTGVGEVLALDAKTGKTKWQQNISLPIRSAPSVSAGKLFFITLNNQVLALDANNGSKLWTYESAPQKASLLGRPAPAVDEGTVITPLSSGELTALRADTGDQLWSLMLSASGKTESLGEINDIKGRAVIFNNVVYASGYNNVTAAVELNTGRLIWEKDIGSINQPWFAGKYIYMINRSYEIVALKAETGEVIWITKLPKYKDAEDKKGLISWVGPVLVSDRLIIAGSDGNLLAISPYTGEILGSEDVGESISIAPIFARGTLLVLTDEGNLYAYK